MSIFVWLVPVCAAVGLLLLASTRPVFFSSRVYAEMATGLLIASFPFIVMTPFSVGTQLFLCALQVGALVLPARLVFGRLDKAFVHPSTVRSAWLLLAASVGTWLVSLTVQAFSFTFELRLTLVLVLVILLQAFFFANILWALWHYRLRLRGTKRTFGELPTVSICIPARNETHALEDCLVSVLASTYQKLEVLVLDDCSQDKTSEIIRSFAHEGVRFVQGDQPADGWLGKNQALQTLAAQAEGEVVLFMDVDTRLTPDGVANLVTYALDNNLEMVTVLPQNRLGLQPGSLLGTLRYFWQLALPLATQRVPVASQLWLIRASSLKSLGGFASVAHAIVPERSFAARLAQRNVYRFVVSNPPLGVTTAKRWLSGVETAIRMLYPTYKRQPFYALAGAAVIGTLLVLPFVVVVWYLATNQDGVVLSFAFTASALAFMNYALVLQRTHPRVWPLAMVALPFIALQECVLIAISLAKYEFGEVNWKGRNVCYPVISSGQIQQAKTALQARRAHR